ncbi:MAG: sigma-70 family RNA polymerase sigma factor [Oscillospiraceae bacterium]|nr:sigma-70 family RNA polymerase sigma factor [Oscillospiraceae bacterium]
MEVFYELHKDELVAVMTRHSRDGEKSKDAVQEAFLKALNHREALSAMKQKSLWAWMYTAAKNALIDEKRRTARVVAYEDTGMAEAADPAPDPTDAIMVRELMHRLPPELMRIVSLRYFGGMNATEIGEMKGIPPSTVRSQLRTALSILRKYAGNRDF